MKNFPTLTTDKKNFVLKPLQKKHIPFLVELLSSPSIQKTLFRVPTKVSEEKEERALERMYSEEKPKEIVYILTITSLLKETPIGYVKIKLIDWSVKSCFLSVAILDSPQYRGKGYAKAAYKTFFEYLFSIGILKIYGRTYETNISTIKLNQATGFTFIGRQKNFVIYPNQTALDALLFEHVHESMDLAYKKPHDPLLQELYREIKPFAEKRNLGSLTSDDLTSAINTLGMFEKKVLPSDWLAFITYTKESLESEKGLNISVAPTISPQDNNDREITYSNVYSAIKEAVAEVFPDITVFSSESIATLEYNRYSATIYVPAQGKISAKEYMYLLSKLSIQISRTLNSYILGIHLTSLLLTHSSQQYEEGLIHDLLGLFIGEPKGTKNRGFDNNNLTLSGDKTMIDLLQFQFMGKILPYTYSAVLSFINKARIAA